ncbi:MAG: AraC family ligand binding domain-containing protein [Actinomycetota bacterium]|nr:AraC family ligand binding domain-containing protein [Actinomycetota bacterium]
MTDQLSDQLGDQLSDQLSDQLGDDERQADAGSAARDDERPEPIHARFVDRVDASYPPVEEVMWPPVVIRAAEIKAQVERLASLPRPADGRRSAWIVHPLAEEPGLGLAPGIRVTLEVLLPGERTAPIRHNSSQVCFCIAGSGFAVVGGEKIAFDQYDVWHTPALTTYFHENDSSERQVRLTYSNAPLLEKIRVHFVDEHPPEEPAVRPEGSDEIDEHPVAHVFPLGERGAMLMSYERLINPEVVEQHPLHWPWREVKKELDQLSALGPSYRGRRLYLLYNPATGRTNGTSNNFFATITLRPPGIVDRPHRHASAAINYFFSGSGWSRVGGKRYEWSAGDLMLTAPGWMIHHHASNDQPVYELTIQDSPLHIAMDSLMWQEDLKRPYRLLGSQRGFATNRDSAL